MTHCIGGTGFSDYVPSFFCFGADIRSYQLPDEIFTVQIDTALAAQNCALAASSLGISMTMLNWASHSQHADAFIRNRLGIPGYVFIVLNAVAGYDGELRGKCPNRTTASVACKIMK